MSVANPPIGDKNQTNRNDKTSSSQTSASSRGTGRQDYRVDEEISESTKYSSENVGHGSGSLAEKAEQVSREVKDKTETAKSALSHKVGEVADKLRDKANNGRLGGAAESMANSLERASSYLEEHDIRSMGHSLSKTIRRYPLQVTLIGIGMGILLGRRGRKSSKRSAARD